MASKQLVSIHDLGSNTKSAEKIGAVVGVISNNMNAHFYSNGEFNLVDIILHVLASTGKADIILSSWSIGNPSLLQLHQAKLEGMIGELYGIVYSRLKTMHPDIFQVATNVFTKLIEADIHAKVVVIKNDAWLLSIVTSANLSYNQRIERYSILSGQTAADDLTFLNKMTKNA